MIAYGAMCESEQVEYKPGLDPEARIGMKMRLLGPMLQRQARPRLALSKGLSEAVNQSGT